MSKVVCVVDDQPSLRQMLRFALTLEGVQVVEAENGFDALNKLAANHIDMMIVDWQMPEMDGLELARRLRLMTEYHDLPIVMVSCRNDMDARTEARGLGVIAWLKKPFRISDIQHVVGNTLGLFRRENKGQHGTIASGGF